MIGANQAVKSARTLHSNIFVKGFLIYISVATGERLHTEKCCRLEPLHNVGTQLVQETTLFFALVLDKIASAIDADDGCINLLAVPCLVSV